MRNSHVTLAGMLLLVPVLASGQGVPAGPTPESVCALLATPEVEKELGRKIFQKGDGMRLAGGAVCDFDGDEAQVMVFTDPGSEANWEGMLKRFGQEKNQRTPVPGLGSSAYLIYPPPKNQYQATVAMVVVRTGNHLLVVSTAAAQGKPAETALAPTVALARLALTRLK